MAEARLAVGIKVIARIAQFSPKAGEEERVLAALRMHRDFIGASAGCRRAFLGTPIHGRHILLYSEWDGEADVNGLEAALRSNPRASGEFFGLLGRLSTPMAIALFDVVD